MPANPETATARHRIIRALRCVRGELTFDIGLAPRFDYGRAPHTARLTDHGAVLTSAGSAITVHAVREPDDERLALAQTTDAGDLSLSVRLRAGQVRGRLLETVADEPREVPPTEVLALFDQTRRFWQSWLAQPTYHGRRREIVDRCAITLKLLTLSVHGVRRRSRYANRRPGCRV
jgi:GH15 family glucan-1,4-alpha-glucosidase